jgi:phosphatidylglycerol lysyltransferase
MLVGEAMSESKSQDNKGKAKAKEDKKAPPQNMSPQNMTQSLKVIQDLRITRSGLSKTMKAIKIEQERLQTAIKNESNRTATSKFRIEALKQYGKGSLAYSSLQSGMEYFMSEDKGFIAYVQMREKNSVCVLADPICADEDLKELIEEFVKEKSDPIFLHASHKTAQVLAEMGFCVNELGVETIIDVQNFSLSGNKKQSLRQSRNNAKKDGIQVVEVRTVDELLFKAFKKISDAWLKEKVVSNTDMQFIVRPIVYVDELDVRRFIAVKDNEVVGFVIFDPMYENGEVIGYIANHLRSNIDRNYSLVDVIIIEAMEKFKGEGKKWLSLGLSPLHKVDDGDEFKHSKLLKANFQYAFENTNYLYNFKNLARHKSKYRPEMPGAKEEKVYCVLKTRFLLTRMYEVYHVLGVSPVKQTVSHLTKKTVDWIKGNMTPRALIGKAKLVTNLTQPDHTNDTLAKDNDSRQSNDKTE